MAGVPVVSQVCQGTKPKLIQMASRGWLRLLARSLAGLPLQVVAIIFEQGRLKRTTLACIGS